MIDDLIFIAKEASKKILEIYNGKDFAVEYKSDESPVTIADKSSNKLICDFLAKKYPDIPILSEENELVSDNIVKSWKRYFAVDPLDGTKEFIGRNGDFAVNIALVSEGKPVCGVMYMPCRDEFYFAERNRGAYLARKNGEKTKLPYAHNKEPVAIVSRSHSSNVETDMLAKMGVKKILNAGGPIKFGLLASGEVDIYLRKTPLMIWDMAAGYIVCEETGVKVTEFDGKEVDFGKILVKGIRGSKL